jgi:uncharacterized protein (DUF2062 family)
VTAPPRSFLRRRLLEPLLRQLRQGVTPTRLAWALALGLVVGCFPVLGTTTLLCAALGLALRLNQPALQVANYLAYPLQLALLLPLFRLGAWLFGAAPVAFTLAGIRAAAAADPWGTLARYGGANLRAVVAWALLAGPAALLLRLALAPLLARLPLQVEDEPGP